ncbi:hypothetical protein [Verrucomicrobium spinosum]|uniref:hypothetical protein n=1 Tax=Verrucomicrobium spinosum TaxID=2736 RepID=UPI0012E26E5C|nr:hypothetical protein [Verrucomicrobium spinosum]
MKTPFPQRDRAGYAPLTDQDSYLELGPDFRFAPPGNSEVTGPFTGDGEEHLVVLETVVGGGSAGNPFRPELGETVVAICPEGGTTWSLLSPGSRQVPYTDAGWAATRRSGAPTS